MSPDHAEFVSSMSKYSTAIVPALVLFMKIGIKNVVGRSLDAPTLYIIFMDVPTDLMFLSISVCAGIASHAGKMSPITTEMLMIYLIFSLIVVIFWRLSSGLFSKGEKTRLIISGAITVINYCVSVSALLHVFAVSISKA